MTVRFQISSSGDLYVATGPRGFSNEFLPGTKFKNGYTRHPKIKYNIERAKHIVMFKNAEGAELEVPWHSIHSCGGSDKGAPLYEDPSFICTGMREEPYTEIFETDRLPLRLHKKSISFVDQQHARGKTWFWLRKNLELTVNID